jgi:hypothetical protein
MAAERLFQDSEVVGADSTAASMGHRRRHECGGGSAREGG